MAISVGFTRPLATPTATETESVAWTLTEDDTNNQIILDRVVTIGANAKLSRRIKLAEVFDGTKQTIRVTNIIFAGSVANYVSSTSPADSLGVAVTYNLAEHDLDVFHTQAGDARS